VGLLGEDAPIRHEAKRRRLRTVMQELVYVAARVVESGRRLALRRDGQTVMFVAVGEAVEGLIGVADPIKATTPRAIEQLCADGLRIVMLTGDNRTTSGRICSSLLSTTPWAYRSPRVFSIPSSACC
jgi:P-type E1-E2 ATPase